ncbi:hypothetical protein H1R20_g10764, partial [Candolleomyces eurysporus]
MPGVIRPQITTRPNPSGSDPQVESPEVLNFALDVADMHLRVVHRLNTIALLHFNLLLEMNSRATWSHIPPILSGSKDKHQAAQLLQDTLSINPIPYLYLSDCIQKIYEDMVPLMADRR